MEPSPMAPLSSPEAIVSSSNAVVNVLFKPFRFTVPSLQTLVHIAEPQRNSYMRRSIAIQGPEQGKNLVSLSDYFPHILSIIDQNGKGERPGFSKRTFTCRETAQIVRTYHQPVFSLRKLTRSFSLSGFATQRARYFSA